MATVDLRFKRILNKAHNHIQDTVLPLGIQPFSELPLPRDMPTALLGEPVGGLAATGIYPTDCAAPAPRRLQPQRYSPALCSASKCSWQRFQFVLRAPQIRHLDTAELVVDSIALCASFDLGYLGKYRFYL
jgi:hypothetical protein